VKKLRKELAALKKAMAAEMNGGGPVMGRAQQLIVGGPKKGVAHEGPMAKALSKKPKSSKKVVEEFGEEEDDEDGEGSDAEAEGAPKMQELLTAVLLAQLVKGGKKKKKKSRRWLREGQGSDDSDEEERPATIGGARRRPQLLVDAMTKNLLEQAGAEELNDASLEKFAREEVGVDKQTVPGVCVWLLIGVLKVHVGAARADDVRAGRAGPELGDGLGDVGAEELNDASLEKFAREEVGVDKQKSWASACGCRSES
jgi:hypothetical protein